MHIDEKLRWNMETWTLCAYFIKEFKWNANQMQQDPRYGVPYLDWKMGTLSAGKWRKC
jgi:hypothetical protein